MEDLKDASINGRHVKISPYDEKEKFRTLLSITDKNNRFLGKNDQ